MNQPDNHLLLGHVTPEKEYDAFNGFKTIFFTIGLVFGGALLITIGIILVCVAKNFLIFLGIILISIGGIAFISSFYF